jgi:fumiquinazoline A oxidase
VTFGRRLTQPAENCVSSVFIFLFHVLLDLSRVCTNSRLLALSSACVGVGGTTVGGGHGWLQGKYGLVIDAIVGMRVALWNGTIVDASATENPDLFWAMRGAGHSFGILLEFTLKTWPQTNGGMLYNVDMAFTDESLEGVLGVMNEIIPTQPADLGMDFVMFTNATTGTVSTCYTNF